MIVGRLRTAGELQVAHGAEALRGERDGGHRPAAGLAKQAGGDLPGPRGGGQQLDLVHAGAQLEVGPHLVHGTC